MQEKNSDRLGRAGGGATTAALGVTVRSIATAPASRTLSASNTQSIRNAIKVAKHEGQPQQKQK